MSDPKPDPSEGLGFRGLVDLGALLVGSVVIATILGYGADALFGTSPVLTLTGIAVGIIAGCWGAWLRVRQFLS